MYGVLVGFMGTGAAYLAGLRAQKNNQVLPGHAPRQGITPFEIGTLVITALLGFSIIRMWRT